MPDEAESLRARVEELHRRLTSEGGMNSELRGQLMQFLSDLERQLSQQSASGKSNTPATLAERLLEAGQRFETTHPVLGTTIGNLADALSRMGI